MIEHARSSLVYERSLKRELEALRADVRAIGQPITRAAVPQAPSVIPKLDEQFSAPPRAAYNTYNGSRHPGPLQAPLPVSASSSTFISPTTPVASQTLPRGPQSAIDPLGSSVIGSHPSLGAGPSAPHPPLSPANVPLPVTPRPSTPSGPTSAHQGLNANGRGIDGSQSMIVPPRVAQLNGGLQGPLGGTVRSPSMPSPSSASSSSFDPLSQSAFVPSVGASSSRPQAPVAESSRSYSYDPLGGSVNPGMPSTGSFGGGAASQSRGAFGQPPSIQQQQQQQQQPAGGLTYAQQQAQAQAEAQARQAQLAARRVVEQREAAQREAARKLANFL